MSLPSKEEEGERKEEEEGFGFMRYQQMINSDE